MREKVAEVFDRLVLSPWRNRGRRPRVVPDRAPVLGSIAEGASGLRRFATDLTVLAVFVLLVYSAVKELRTDSLTVLPVSVPETLGKEGYTAVAASQRIAHEMAAVVRGRQTSASNIQASGVSAAGQRILASQEVPDIQIPGQEISFRTIFRFVETALGLDRGAVSVSISEDGTDYVADILVVGGPYNGIRETVRRPRNRPLEELFSSIGVRAVAAALPVPFAIYVADTAPGLCAAGIDCNPEGALAVLSRLLGDAYPDDDAAAHLALSMVLLNRDPSEAVRHCEVAKTLNPTLGWAYIYCAYASDLIKKRPNAVQYALEAARRSWNDPDLHAGIGDVLLDLNHESDAEAQYQAALALDANHVYSRIGLGTVARRRKQFREAEAHFRAALLVNPMEPYAHGGLGMVLVASGTFDDAIPHLEKALLFDPRFQIAADAWTRARISQAQRSAAVTR
ncbi:MAG: tetratricopeptide repeat protein [Acidobacteria bacterium]|nr:tetratricopeptide repeat protein [Acidobacteriota bacterium]